MERIIISVSICTLLISIFNCRPQELDEITADEAANAAFNTVRYNTGGDLSDFEETGDEDTQASNETLTFSPRPSGDYTGTWTGPYGQIDYSYNKQYYDATDSPVVLHQDASCVEWVGNTQATVVTQRYNGEFNRDVVQSRLCGLGATSTTIVLNAEVNRNGSSTFQGFRQDTVHTYDGTWHLVWNVVELDKECLGTGACYPLAGDVTITGGLTRGRINGDTSELVNWNGENHCAV